MPASAIQHRTADAHYYEADIADITTALVENDDVIDSLDGSTILLTGAMGFLGRWLVRVFQHINSTGFIEEPIKLICVDAVDNHAHEINDENTKFIHHDLNANVRLEVGDSLDYIIHAAGIASPFWYKKHPLETIDVAVHGARQCLELAKRNDARFLFTSSSEVYQTASVVPTPETYVGAVPTMETRSCYDVSKLLGETLAHVYHHEFNIHATVIRIFNSFGVGMKQQDHRILPKLATAMKTDTPFTVFSHPEMQAILPTRTYCPCANTIFGLLLALTRGASDHAYNIGLDRPELDTEQIATRAQNVMARQIKIQRQVARAYSKEPMRRCPDLTKARNQLGYREIVSLDQGLERFFSWAMETYQ